MSTLWSNNESPSILMANQDSTPETPDAGFQRLFTRVSDGHLCRIDSDGNIYDLSGSGSGGLTLLSADPASPSDGDVWFVDDGGSPASVACRFRKGGVSYTLVEVTV